MMVTEKIVVLLAAYNGAEYLHEQIDSILAQNDVNVTVYISLDKSTDNSLAILEHYAKVNTNVILLEYGKHFGSAGQNFFNLMNTVDVCDFDFVAFADQDDIWEPLKLREAITLLTKTNADGYSSNVMAFWENGRETLIEKSSAQVEFDYLFESPGPGCTFVFTKKLFNSIQQTVKHNYYQINKLWLHDWFCYSFSRFNGFEWIIDSRPLMKYRQHLSNQVGANSGMKSFITRIKAMFDGRGLNYVQQQADFLGQQQCRPIVYLSQGRVGYFKLALISHKLRRKFSHKLFCAIFFFIMVIKGYKSVQRNQGNQK
ncbi:glycosyltransferase [Shewanella sp. 202IG2-18]|uniref:glycosyltransferase n=1 Tax=Parashewanella hymeniacidonis TaxID=2807618 RepID=UPI001961766D|nr:glycosyltransferase [Parashewanella hymeniacidonis]MBM7072106.1 glycosyltransferase [Parashewanella hymeniacidonis]